MTRHTKLLLNATLAMTALPLSIYILWQIWYGSVPLKNLVIADIALMIAALIGHFRGAKP